MNKELVQFIKDIIRIYKIKNIEGFIKAFFGFIENLRNSSFDMDQKEAEMGRIIIAYSTLSEDEIRRGVEKELKDLLYG